MNNSDILSDPELRRFGNQIALPQVGMEGQEKLKKAKVVVIGAGGLGTNVLQYLAAIGVGHLGIIDYGLVEESNIQRQILYGGNDLGKLKTIISKQNLQNLFPTVNFEIINIQLTSGNIERILGQFEFIVDATNNDACHDIINNACGSLKLPWVYGSITGFEGQVAVFDLNKGSSYINLQALSLKTNNGIKGGTALSYGFIGNIMAFEVFKFVIGNDKSLHNKYLAVDLLTYQFSVKSII